MSSYQPRRELVTAGLERLLKKLQDTEAKHSTVLYTKYFQRIALAQLKDFHDATEQSLCCSQHPRKANETYPVRVFLALSSLENDSPSFSDELAGGSQTISNAHKLYGISSLDYLGSEVNRRDHLMLTYERALHLSTTCNASIQELFTELLLRKFQVGRGLHAANLFEQGLRTAMRWIELEDIAGDAIILCGSPFVDDDLPFNIPKIVQTGSDEEFASLKEAILGDCSWIQDTCRQLQVIGSDMKIFFAPYEMPSGALKRVKTTSRRVLGKYDKFMVVARELRRMGHGLTVHQVLDRISNQGSTGINHAILYVCLFTIVGVMADEKIDTEAKLAASSEAVLQSVMMLEHRPVAKRSTFEFYVRHIIRSLSI